MSQQYSQILNFVTVCISSFQDLNCTKEQLPCRPGCNQIEFYTFSTRVADFLEEKTPQKKILNQMSCLKHEITHVPSPVISNCLPLTNPSDPLREERSFQDTPLNQTFHVKLGLSRERLQIGPRIGLSFWLSENFCLPTNLKDLPLYSKCQINNIW